MRVSLLVLLVASPALADPVPGTGGDPLRELMVDPAFTYTDRPIGLPLRGGGPEDTVLLFDGFELPWAFHDGGVRSLVPPDAAGIELLRGGFGVEYGRGSSIVALSSRNGQQSAFGALTTLDAHAHVGRSFASSSLRIGDSAFADQWRASSTNLFVDVLGHLDVPLTKRWTLAMSAIGASDEVRDVYRVVAGLQYSSRTWSASLAASPMASQEPGSERISIDTRGEIIRRASAAAGLTKLEWRLGQQTTSTHYDLADLSLWRNDIGLWSSVGAHLSSRIRATAGVRVDNFDGDVATQPRATLSAFVTRHLELLLAAGAYRRPPRQLAEVVEPSLHPERATQVIASATFDNNHGYRLVGTTYYIDRRRLIVRDAAGDLVDTGFGTSKGVELSAALSTGPWQARIAGALASSQRSDYVRALQRPAPFEQPFRLEVLGAWTRKRVTLSARLQLASGLPYTPFIGGIYNSDTDAYEPLYVDPLSARTPFHHQVDLRIDYRFALGRFPCHAFIDLHNAYGNRDAIGYRYSYDFGSRADITALPLFPFAGLRAYL